MRYSVYNYTRRAYDYYDAPGPGGTHAGSPRAPRAIKDVGAPPDQAAWRLPSGARRVGAGPLPQGRIASLEGSDELTDHRVLVYAVLGLIAWKVFA